MLNILQCVSLSYGICAGLRGFFFSLLNTELIQKLRYVVGCTKAANQAVTCPT